MASRKKIWTSSPMMKRQKNGIKIEINYNELTEILKNRIGAGISQFEQRRQDALKLIDNKTNVEPSMHIFLSGNSCKSKIVVDTFNERYKTEIENNAIVIHPPLEQQESKNRIFSPNGKTGVAWGLLDINDSVKFIDTDLSKSGKAEFKFFVGIGRKGKFIPKISPAANYGDWNKLVRANKDTVTVYYTDNFEAGSKQLSLEEDNVKFFLIEVDDPTDEKYIYIRTVESDEIEFSIVDENEVSFDITAAVVSYEDFSKIETVIDGKIERRKLN